MPARTTHAPLNDTDEGKGQRDEEPRVFSVDGVVSSGKSSNSATREHFVTGKTMAAGAFFVPPKQGFADVVDRDTHSVWYVMRGQLTIEEEGAGEKKVVPQGKAAYLAPGASVKVHNEGSDELLVYYASAAK
jgi:mannose-6-phosphate isomerase-like protein (cupin superfamily)